MLHHVVEPQTAEELEADAWSAAARSNQHIKQHLRQSYNHTLVMFETRMDGELPALPLQSTGLRDPNHLQHAHVIQSVVGFL